MIDIFFVSYVIINSILSMLMSFFYSKMWFFIINTIFFFIFLIIYILLSKEINLNTGTEKRKKFILMLVFIWSLTNLFLSAAGYTFTFFISLNKKNVDFESSQPVKEIVANPSQKAVLYGRINVLPQKRFSETYVANAQVVLRDFNNELILDQTYSDEEGKFRIVLNVPQENNVYNLYIYHERYYEYTTKVQLIPGIIHELEITLTPK